MLNDLKGHLILYTLGINSQLLITGGENNPQKIIKGEAIAITSLKEKSLLFLSAGNAKNGRTNPQNIQIELNPNQTFKPF